MSGSQSPRTLEQVIGAAREKTVAGAPEELRDAATGFLDGLQAAMAGAGPGLPQMVTDFGDGGVSYRWPFPTFKLVFTVGPEGATCSVVSGTGTESLGTDPSKAAEMVLGLGDLSDPAVWNAAIFDGVRGRLSGLDGDLGHHAIGFVDTLESLTREKGIGFRLPTIAIEAEPDEIHLVWGFPGLILGLTVDSEGKQRGWVLPIADGVADAGGDISMEEAVALVAEHGANGRR